MAALALTWSLLDVMVYLARTVDRELDELLPTAQAVAIDGPKGVGKTDTAQRRADTVWFLDDSAQRDTARADLAMSTLPAGTVLLDEWQKLPQVWDLVVARWMQVLRLADSC